MTRYINNSIGFSTCIFLLTASLATAGNVLYENDFEEGTLRYGEANPVWSLRAGNVDLMGPGNFFEIVSGSSHSGQYSLRFNYEGRNAICNMCGGKTRMQKSGADNTTFFVDSEGIDLSQDPIFASPDKYVYNRSDGYSKWSIVSVDSQDATNNKLSLIKLQDGIGAARNRFNGGDSVNIYRQCGVDGFIGGDIDRRSDYNVAINYFSGVSQSPGESIFRRVYIKIETGTNLPYHQKIRYWKTREGRLITLRVQLNSQTGAITAAVAGMKGMGGPGLAGVGINLNTGTWYYVEEEFKAQSATDVNDGEYRMWFAKSGEETNEPVIEVTGLDLDLVKENSLWGNHQHNTDSSGYWYFDDIKIANIRIGPTGATGENITPPNPPMRVK